MKKYLYILILLGIFTSSFFIYNNFQVLVFTKKLSSQLVDAISQELSGNIANSVVLCVNNTNYKVFIDNNLDSKFNANTDQILFKENIDDFIVEQKCFKLACAKGKSSDFELIIKKKIFVDFLFFSPKFESYKIIFNNKTCFINFLKYSQ